VLWTMELPGDSLVWNVEPLHGGPAPELRTLWPVEEDGRMIVEVEVVHGMESEMPGGPGPTCPIPGRPPQHIASCLPILFQHFQMPDVTYSEDQDCMKRTHLPKTLNAMDMTTTFSCMITSGDMP
jgi:hypothetical protein